MGHVKDVITQGKADAISCASILHYDYIDHNLNSKEFAQEGNIEYLKSGRSFTKIKPVNLLELKNFLLDHGIKNRLPALGSLAMEALV